MAGRTSLTINPTAYGIPKYEELSTPTSCAFSDASVSLNFNVLVFCTADPLIPNEVIRSVWGLSASYMPPSANQRTAPVAAFSCLSC